MIHGMKVTTTPGTHSSHVITCVFHTLVRETLATAIVVLFGGAAAGPLAGLFYGLGVRSDDQM